MMKPKMRSDYLGSVGYPKVSENGNGFGFEFRSQAVGPGAEISKPRMHARPKICNSFPLSTRMHANRACMRGLSNHDENADDCRIGAELTGIPSNSTEF